MDLVIVRQILTPLVRRSCFQEKYAIKQVHNKARNLGALVQKYWCCYILKRPTIH